MVKGKPGILAAREYSHACRVYASITRLRGEYEPARVTAPASRLEHSRNIMKKQPQGSRKKNAQNGKREAGDSRCARIFSRLSLICEHNASSRRIRTSARNRACIEIGASSQYNEKTTSRVVFSLYGGGSWIRTSEVSDNRFTVCPLWPLGNSPI